MVRESIAISELLLTPTAFLEQILLDEAGKIRERYRDEGVPQRSDGTPQNGTRATGEVAALRGQGGSDVAAVRSTGQQLHTDTSTQQGETVTNPLKRKHSEPELERWFFATEELDLAQQLPSQAVLLKIVDFFTISFHHWIPYLHKQRLRDKVSEGVCSNGLLLVLHALVAVALRHMDSDALFMDSDQIRKQSSISHTIVETHAIRSVSIESLQALIFIVFDYVSSCLLISTVRAKTIVT